MIFYETERLILRNYKQDDIDDLFAYMSSDYTALHEDFDPYSRDDCEKAIDKWYQNDYYWTVELKSENKLIGSLNYSEEDYETYEIGYDFNESYTGYGYATESCKILLYHIFTINHGRRVIAGCNEENVNSYRLLERLGFRREGLFREDVSFKSDKEGNPIYVNSYYYGMLKREWDLLPVSAKSVTHKRGII